MNKFKRLAVAVAATTIVAVPVTTLPAQAVDFGQVKAVKGNGPGIRNWHCVDYSRSPDWWGPWRVLRGSAEADCLDYLRYGNT